MVTDAGLTAWRQNGITMVRGTVPRPVAAAIGEQKYKHQPGAPIPRWQGETILLSRHPRYGDVRSPIEMQGNLGCCACCAACTLNEMCMRLTGRAPIEGHFGALYEDVRKEMRVFPQNSGTYMALNLDIIMRAGVPREDAERYIEDPAWQYDRRLWEGAQAHNHIARHEARYPAEGQLVDWIARELREGRPIMVGSWWPNAWFDPRAGVLPENTPWNPLDGGHAWVGYGLGPLGLAGDNSWSEGYAQDAHQTGGYDLRPGSFILPLSYLTRPANDTPLFEFRSVEPVPVVIPDPLPPVPDPDGYARALAAGQAEQQSMYDYWMGRPESTDRKWWYMGGAWMVDKIRAAQTPAASAIWPMPPAERPE